MVGSLPEKKLVIDSKRNVWLFYPTSSGKIAYVFKKNRAEAKTAQLGIDGYIRDIDLLVDENDTIHVTALNSGQKIFYLRHEADKWMSHVLYSFAGKQAAVSKLKIVKQKASLHLFYLYSERGGSCALFHHHWTGNGWKGYKVFDMPKEAGKICYDADVAGDGSLHVIAAEQKGLYLWEFNNGLWNEKASGKNEEWEGVESITLQGDLVLFRNYRGAYFLSGVQRLGSMQPEEIVTGEHVEQGPVVVNRKNTLYAAWTQGNSLGYRTSYDGGLSWGRVKYYHHALDERLEVYGFSNNYSLLVDAKRMIATRPPELHIPFLHRSSERIKLPVEAYDEAEKGSPKSISEAGPVPGKPSNNTEVRHNGNTIKEGNLKQNDTQADPDSGKDERFSEKSAARIERIEAGLDALEKRLEGEVLEKLQRLGEEIRGLKKILENTNRKLETTEPEAGSIITQDLINRCQKKK